MNEIVNVLSLNGSLRERFVAAWAMLPLEVQRRLAEKIVGVRCLDPSEDNRLSPDGGACFVASCSPDRRGWIRILATEALAEQPRANAVAIFFHELAHAHQVIRSPSTTAHAYGSAGYDAEEERAWLEAQQWADDAVKNASAVAAGCRDMEHLGRQVRRIRA